MLRHDLYHRLNTFELYTPPLRKHLEDIPELCKHFCRIFSKSSDCPLDISKQAMKKLQDFHWPGNVRELRACIERACAITTGQNIEADLITFPKASAAKLKEDKAPDKLEDLERAHIKRVLKECDGNYTQAARRLGISRPTLYSRLKKG